MRYKINKDMSRSKSKWIELIDFVKNVPDNPPAIIPQQQIPYRKGPSLVLRVLMQIIFQQTIVLVNLTQE